MATIIISPYDDLLPENMGIEPEKLDEFKYRYNLSNCTIENSNLETRVGQIPYLIVTKSGNRKATIRKSRITALIN